MIKIVKEILQTSHEHGGTPKKPFVSRLLILWEYENGEGKPVSIDKAELIIIKRWRVDDPLSLSLEIDTSHWGDVPISAMPEICDFAKNYKWRETNEY